MKCISHVSRDAECYCNICGQPICGECRDKLAGCIYCAEKAVRDFKKEWIISIVLFVCSFLFMLVSAIKVMPLEEIIFGILISLVSSLAIASVPFGWNGLNKLTPNIFLFLPLAGWALYFFIKFTLSFFLGWIFVIINIFSTYKIIKKLDNNAKKMKYEIRNGNL